MPHSLKLPARLQHLPGGLRGSRREWRLAGPFAGGESSAQIRRDLPQLRVMLGRYAFPPFIDGLVSDTEQLRQRGAAEALDKRLFREWRWRWRLVHEKKFTAGFAALDEWLFRKCLLVHARKFTAGVA